MSKFNYEAFEIRVKKKGDVWVGSDLYSREVIKAEVGLEEITQDEFDRVVTELGRSDYDVNIDNEDEG